MNNCRLNIPYPRITTEGMNRMYADILFPLYAGPYGELNGLTTYMYQAVVTEQKDKRLSDILECIAVTEMKHFRMLGRIIYMLGSNPKLYFTNSKGKRTWWSGQDISYDPDIKSFINRSIEEELYGIQAYTNALERINDKYVAEVLKRIILDEKHHLKIFEDLLK